MGIVFWGCQANAPSLWTQGAFLRQDWFFYLVLSICLMKKGFYKLSGASIAYSTLLRIFPGVTLLAGIASTIVYVVKYRKIPKLFLNMALGGILATVLLVSVSLKVVGIDSYKQFFEHTIKVHDHTPLTNHMGLRVMLSHRFSTGFDSGRMKYSRETERMDPFSSWKQMRNDRYQNLKWVVAGLSALTFGLFVFVSRRIKSLWVIHCLGQIWMILLAQLTNYYYSFMILLAPLTKVDRRLEAILFAYALVTQIAYNSFRFTDDRYAILTWLSLAFSFFMVIYFVPKSKKFVQQKIGN